MNDSNTQKKGGETQTQKENIILTHIMGRELVSKYLKKFWQVKNNYTVEKICQKNWICTSLKRKSKWPIYTWQCSTSLEITET